MYKYVVIRRGKDKVEWEYVLHRHSYTYGSSYRYSSQAEVNRKFAVLEKERSYAGLHGKFPFSRWSLLTEEIHTAFIMFYLIHSLIEKIMVRSSVTKFGSQWEGMGGGGKNIYEVLCLLGLFGKPGGKIIKEYKN